MRDTKLDDLDWLTGEVSFKMNAAPEADQNSSGMELFLANYRNGLRVGLWLLAVFGGLAGVTLILWGLLASLGDHSGALVVRVLLLVWLGALLVDLVVLVTLLTCLQLDKSEREKPQNGE